MNDLTPEPIAELRRLAEAATPGPWRTEYLMGAGNDLLTAIIAGRATPDDLRVIGSTLAERDGKFVAAASPAVVLALLDELDELRAEVGVRRDARKALAHKLVADFQANGNSRELGDPTAGAWLEAAQQVLDALNNKADR